MKRLLGGLAACLTCAALAPAAPAAEHGIVPAASFCTAPALFAAGSDLARSATGGREPDLGQAHTDLPAGAKGKAGPRFAATVPVYFHVITDRGVGQLSDTLIANQVEVLNTTFGGEEGGADTGFAFRLAGVTRTDDASWFNAKAGGAAENAMKRTLRRGGDDALNVYTSLAGGFLGYAFLPDITTKPGQAHLDGVVLDWRTVPGASPAYAGRYDLGETLTHETGHWLDLEHTFFGGCNAKGDYVADTPAERTPTSGCPAGKDTCSEPGDDPIHNYMDYSYDSCYTEFTNGQAQRMADAWLLYRAP